MSFIVGIMVGYAGRFYQYQIIAWVKARISKARS